MTPRTIRDPAAPAVLVQTAPGGGWAVRRRHVARALRRFPDQTEAVTYATATAARDGLTVYVHDDAGTLARVIHPDA